MATKITYEKWGNNEWHDPSLCKTCEYDTCSVCSNGPRGDEYRRAMAEKRLNDMCMALSWNDNGLYDDY